MEIKLSKTKKSEVRLLAKIFMEEFSKPPYNERWTLNKAIKKIKVFRNLYDCYTIIYSGQKIGFIAINPVFMCPGAVAFGEDMAIKEEFQGRGIGTWVLNRISGIYKKKGFNYFMGIAHKKSKALKLYKKKGFSVDKDFIIIGKELK